jgi:hypothetical protein
MAGRSRARSGGVGVRILPLLKEKEVDICCQRVGQKRLLVNTWFTRTAARVPCMRPVPPCHHGAPYPLPRTNSRSISLGYPSPIPQPCDPICLRTPRLLPATRWQVLFLYGHGQISTILFDRIVGACGMGYLKAGAPSPTPACLDALSQVQLHTLRKALLALEASL